MILQEDRDAQRRRREEMAGALVWAAGLPWVIDLREPSALLDLGEPLVLAPAEGGGWLVMLREERLCWEETASEAARWIVRRYRDRAAQRLEEASAAHEQLAQLLEEEVSAEASTIRRAPEGAQTGAASPATLPVEVAPTSAPPPVERIELFGACADDIEDEPAPNSPADLGGYEPPTQPAPPKTGKRAVQAQIDRYHDLIEPVERDARELLYEMIRSRHGGRTYDQLLAVELIAICDYLEQMPPQARSAQIRLRSALKKLDLPSWLNRHTTPCEACGELVLWVWTKAAKSALALDAEPAEGGIYTVEDKPDDKKRVIATCWGTPAVGGRHAHSKTCAAKAGRTT